MLGKSKEVSGRYGGPNDLTRVLGKGLDLLNSSSPDSDHELLELVKKAKREGDKELVHLSKKLRPGRATAELSEAQPLGHRSSSTSLPTDHVATGADAAATSTSLGGIGHAQARLMNVIRSGTARGRGDKAKRKANR